MNIHSKTAIENSFIDQCEKAYKWFSEIGACTTAIQKRGMTLLECEEMLGELVVSEIYSVHINQLVTLLITFLLIYRSFVKKEEMYLTMTLKGSNWVTGKITSLIHASMTLTQITRVLSSRLRGRKNTL